MNGQFRFAVCLMLPLAASGVIRLCPAQPVMVQEAPARRSMAFDQYSVNLREAPLRPILWGDFRFTNVGDAPLTITELKPSCGCLQPQLADEKRTYLPGERGMFRVQVATANEAPGPQAYTVSVKYTDPQPHETTVRFKVTLPERKVSVEPSELAFFQYNGEPGTRDVVITDFRGSTLEVTGVSSSVDLIATNVMPAETDEAGHHRVPIRLTVPGTVPAGRQIATVTIETNDPEFAVIRIPVLIDGPAHPAGEIQLIGHEAPADDPSPMPAGD